jgi:hypothetical protein
MRHNVSLGKSIQYKLENTESRTEQHSYAFKCRLGNCDQREIVTRTKKQGQLITNASKMEVAEGCKVEQEEWIVGGGGMW